MRTVLRVALILLLILSVAALIMGTMLFQQREVLKGRLQMTENTLRDVAATIEAEEADDLAQLDLPVIRLDRDQLRTFYQVDVMGDYVLDEEGNRIASGTGTMHELLGELRGRAAIQYNRLNDTRSALAQTRVELVDTRREMDETQEKLAQTERELEQTREQLAAARVTIETQRTEIAGLNRDKERLEGDLTEQQRQLSEMRDDIAGLREENQQYLRIMADLQDQIVKGKRLPEEGDEPGLPGGVRTIPPGLKGQVLLVNDAWNFVIIDLGEEDRDIQPTHVLFVQRDDQLVGKVRISEVKGDDRRLAVADIMGDWLQMPIREGDNVFF